jgi:hypothetical protein
VIAEGLSLVAVVEEATFAQDWDDAIDEITDLGMEVVKVHHESVSCPGFKQFLEVVGDLLGGEAGEGGEDDELDFLGAPAGLYGGLSHGVANGSVLF